VSVAWPPDCHAVAPAAHPLQSPVRTREDSAQPGRVPGNTLQPNAYLAASAVPGNSLLNCVRAWHRPESSRILLVQSANPDESMQRGARISADSEGDEGLPGLTLRLHWKTSNSVSAAGRCLNSGQERNCGRRTIRERLIARVAFPIYHWAHPRNRPKLRLTFQWTKRQSSVYCGEPAVLQLICGAQS
jgi:hypothetical protein